MTTTSDSTPTPEDPTPQSPEGLRATVPGFFPPPAPIHDPTDPASTTVSDPAGDVDADGLSGSGGPRLTLPEIGPSQVSTADPAAFEGLIAMAFGGLGLLLHARLTPGDDNAVWIPDEQDITGVAGPLARIVARRVKVADRIAGDLTDVMDAGVAVGAYAVENMRDQAAWRAGPPADEGAEVPA